MPADRYSWSRAMRDLRADVERYRVVEGHGTLVNLWLAPGLLASVRLRLAHWAWSGRGPVHLLARGPLLVLQRLVEVWSGVSIAPQAVIGPGLYIGHFGGIIVHGDAVLGSNVSLSQEVTIGVAGRGDARGTPTLGDRVHVAPGAKLFGPITLGDDVAVGANAVVTRDVPDRGVVAGVPARLLSTAGSFDFVHYPGMDADPARQASHRQLGA